MTEFLPQVGASPLALLLTSDPKSTLDPASIQALSKQGTEWNHDDAGVWFAHVQVSEKQGINPPPGYDYQWSGD